MSHFSLPERIFIHEERRLMMNDIALEGALKRCSLHSLLILTSKVLSRSGFGDVQILDRRQPRQRSRFSGYEMMCLGAIGSVPVKVVVKVIRDSVRVRMLDELAGVVVRSGADMGILVSQFHLSPTAVKHQPSYNSVRLEVLDVKELATLMRRYGIGVRERGSVDYQFFDALEEVGTRIVNFMRQEAA